MERFCPLQSTGDDEVDCTSDCALMSSSGRCELVEVRRELTQLKLTLRDGLSDIVYILGERLK